MSTILDEIIAHKRIEIEKRKALQSIASFSEFKCWQRPPRSLKKRLLEESSTGIIAEFKRKSPSKGWFKSNDLPVDSVVTYYNDAGAAGISVLTDEYFFGGTLNDLERAHAVTEIPLLRKDFMIDEWQVAEAKAYGADLILLIAACLSPKRVQQLAAAAKETGLEVLLEIHNELELDHICDEVDMVGVNNRNLKTFEVDVNLSRSLIGKIPAEKPAIAESGISNPQTIVSLKEAGFKGFLVGERFMKADQPGQAFRDFVNELRSLDR
jgi:indole-3-glycerol phosphate synthase